MKQGESPNAALLGVFVCPDVLFGKKTIRRIHCIKKAQDAKAFFLSCGRCSEEGCKYVSPDSFRSSYPELIKMIDYMRVGDMWLLKETEDGEKWVLKPRFGEIKQTSCPSTGE